MISFVNVGQLCGHSCLSIDTSTRLSLLRKVRCDFRLSSVLELWMIKLTTKFRMPGSLSLCELKSFA